MKDTQDKQLFTEITTEESATVNGGGGCGYYQSWSPRYRYNYSSYRRPYNQTVNVYFNNNNNGYYRYY